MDGPAPVLFKAEILERIERGEIDLAFRRWRRPTVKAGGRLRTPIGEIAIGRMDLVVPEAVSDGDVARAGFSDRDSSENAFASGGGALHRIELGPLTADPRETLRQDADLTVTDHRRICNRLARLDASRGRDYGLSLLSALVENEGTPARLLAERLDMPMIKLKRDMRRLKEMGLTESLSVGYRLSPRGRAFVAYRAEGRR